MKKKSVLLITDYADQWGGAEKLFFMLATELAQCGFQPVVLSFGGGDMFDKLKGKNIICEACSVLFIQRPITFFNLFRYLYCLFKMIKTIHCLNRKYSFSLLYASKSTCLIYSISASLVLGIPCVWHVQNLNRNFGKIGKWLIKKVSAIVMISDYVREPFVSSFGNLSKFYKIYNGTKTDMPLRQITHIKTIGMVAHFVAWKNHELFLKVIPFLRKTHPHLQFVIYGETLHSNPDEQNSKEFYKQKLLLMAHELKIEDCTKFAGYEENEDEIYSGIDLLFHPSHQEAFGMIIIEAMSRGIPVVASDAGGPKEIITHGYDGLLFNGNDPQEVAKTISVLIFDSELFQKLRQAAVKTVRKKFSKERYVEEMRSLFDEIYIPGEKNL